MTKIGGNLQEIYSACNREGLQEDYGLVPSLLTKRLYDSSRGWGRLWKWFYQAVHRISKKDLKTTRLIQVMQATQKAFDERLPSIINDVQTYHSYLKKLIEGKETEEKKIHLIRKNITNWTSETAPFVDFLEKNPERTASLFQTCFGEDVEEGKSLFSYGDKKKALLNTQLLIDLEGYLQQPLPIALFQKLAVQETLSSEEKQSLGQWIELLNQMKEEIPVRLFIDFLRIIANHPTFKGDLTTLEIELLKNGLKLLLMPEKEHLLWRNALKPGDELEGENTNYVLGDPIGRKEEAFDTNLLFEIEGDPDHVLAIGMNRTYWPIKQKIGEEEQWAVHMPKVIEIAAGGRFAIIEKLTPAISENQWQTSENGPLIERDEAILTPIGNLLKWWREVKRCPSRFCLHDLMFNQEGELKYVHVLEPQLLNFRFFEDLAYEISQGSLQVYKFIFESSGIKDDMTLNFYRKIVEETLKGASLDTKKIKSFAAHRKVSDQEVIQRGKQLHKKILEMRGNILKTLDSGFEISEEVRPQLLKKTNEELLQWYTRTYSASLIWPAIEPSVTKNLRRFLQRYSCPIKDEQSIRIQ